MICKYCGASTSVSDTRQIEDGEAVRRRRLCDKCGRRFTTYERPAEVDILVRKRSGSVEAYDHSKLRRGVEAACSNLLPSDAEGVIWGVESELDRMQREQVDSALIGKMVLDRLEKLDKIAYMRFAMHHKHFQTLEEIQNEVAKLLQ